MPPSIWPGKKSPLVLTLSDPETQLSNDGDLWLLHHFKVFTSHDLGFPAIDTVNGDITVNLALEVRLLFNP